MNNKTKPDKLTKEELDALILEHNKLDFQEKCRRVRYYKVGSQHVNRISGVVARINENAWEYITLSRANGSTSRIQPHYFANAYIPLPPTAQKPEESPTRKLISLLRRNTSGVSLIGLEAADRLERMERALLIFSEVNLTESNCASFDVANRRIRNAALAALK